MLQKIALLISISCSSALFADDIPQYYSDVQPQTKMQQIHSQMQQKMQEQWSKPQNQPPQQVMQKPIKAEQPPLNSQNFAQRKQMVIQRIQQRQHNLQESLDCVNAAQTPEAFQICKLQASKDKK
ncbi:MAG: hypothetical protein WCW84_13185 [Sulfurimonas sp.]|jgi:aspartate/tyrosine/aromatic aminotransferase